MRFHVMAKGLLVTMSLMAGLLAPVSASAAGPAPASALDQESIQPSAPVPLPPNHRSEGSAWISKNQWSAQPFVARSTGILTSVTLAMSRFVDASATNFTVSILATSNGRPTGVPLESKYFGQSSVDVLSLNRVLPPSSVVVIFETASVVAGTVYSIQLTTTDVPGDSGGVYHWFIGNYCMTSLYWNSNSGEWVDFVDSGVPEALAFTTTVAGTPVLSGDLPAPVNVMMASVPGGVSLSFNMCKDNGSPVDFELANTEFLLNGSDSWQPMTPTDSASPVLIPGLSDDTPLSMQVRVLGSRGTSPASTPVNFTPGLVASAPTNVVALPLNQGAQISFTAGSDNGKPITAYQYNISGSQEWLPVDGGDVTSPVTVSGLTNGIYTRFVIRAVTARGGGRSSNVSEVNPGTPEAPVSLVVTPVADGVSIAFQMCRAGSTPITNVGYFFNGNNTFTALNPPSSTSPVFVPMGGSDQVTLRLVNSVGPSIDSEMLRVTSGIGGPQVVGTVTTCASGSDGQDGDSSNSGGQSGNSSGGSSGGGPVNSPMLSLDSSNSSIPPAGTSTVLVPSSLPSSTVANSPCGVSVGAMRPVQRIINRGSVRVVHGARKPATRKASGVASPDTCLAPVVLAKAGVPMRAMVTGLPAGRTMRLQAMVNGRWRSLGIMKTTAQGTVKTPAIVSQQRGSVMLRARFTSVDRYFVRLIVRNPTKHVQKRS